MVIQKYTNNLYASEVYRELERQAVRNGHFKPSEEQQIKVAAQRVEQQAEINKPIDVTPSNDLVQDVARLAYAMRRKGYVVQADDLEQKLVMFKKAESDLYNVTQEKNKDFIQFSHRDGDVEIIEGAGELGTIETIESLAEKIRAVTLKQPTGKLAALANMIVKIADGTVPPEDWNKSVSIFNSARDKFDEGVDLSKIAFTQTPRTEQLMRLYQTYTGVDVATIQTFNQVSDILSRNGMLNQDTTINTGVFRLGSVGRNPEWVEPAKQVANLLGVGNDYFTSASGVSSTDRAMLASGRQWSDPSRINVNSIYLEDLTLVGSQVNQLYVGSTTNVSRLVSELSQKWQELRTKAWGQGNSLWNEATRKAQADASAFIGDVKSVSINESGVVDGEVVDVGVGVNAIREAKESIAKAIDEHEQARVTISLLSPETYSVINNNATRLNSEADRAMAELVKNDSLWGETVDDISGSLTEVIDAMNKVKANRNASGEQRKAANDNIIELRRLQSLLHSAGKSGVRWVSLQPKLSQYENLGDVQSWGDAKQIINTHYVEDAKKWAESIIGKGA